VDELYLAFTEELIAILLKCFQKNTYEFTLQDQYHPHAKTRCGPYKKKHRPMSLENTNTNILNKTPQN
jgi:hypothetical protein